MWECVTSVVFPGLAVERDVVDNTADRQIGDDGAAEEHVRRAALDIHKDRIPDPGVRHVKGDGLVPGLPFSSI